MVIQKITNNKPFGMFILKVFLGPTSDRRLIEVQNATNLAISHYANLIATRENCEELKGYMNHYLALCNNCQDSDVKEDLKSQLTNIIDTLQTGIDSEPAYSTSTRKSSTTPISEQTWEQRLYRAMQRWEVWGWRNRPINKDPNTLEGYIRSLPRIEQMDIKYFFEHHLEKVVHKFWTQDKNEDTDKFVRRIEADVIQKFAFVKLTTMKPVYQVIENQYDDADELYEYVQELGIEEPVASETIEIETETQNQVAI